MFPELEGYTSAVPSKRDLMSFVKAVQLELVDAASESDVCLIRFVFREIEQAVKEFFPSSQMKFPAQLIIATGTKPN